MTSTTQNVDRFAADVKDQLSQRVGGPPIISASANEPRFIVIALPSDSNEDVDRLATDIAHTLSLAQVSGAKVYSSLGGITARMLRQLLP